jgi:cytochrome c oxidase assembly protein subunit 15
MYATAGVSLIIILTGALVRGAGATLACIDWPLCNGELLPAGQGPLQVVHMTHRFSVAAFGLLLVLLMWYVFRSERPAAQRTLSVVAFVLYLLQSGIGALFVLEAAAPLWGTLHVGFASLTWGALIALSVIETANNGALRFNPGEVEWQQTSGAKTPQ